MVSGTISFVLLTSLVALVLSFEEVYEPTKCKITLIRLDKEGVFSCEAWVWSPELFCRICWFQWAYKARLSLVSFCKIWKERRRVRNGSQSSKRKTYLNYSKLARLISGSNDRPVDPFWQEIREKAWFFSFYPLRSISILPSNFTSHQIWKIDIWMSVLCSIMLKNQLQCFATDNNAKTLNTYNRTPCIALRVSVRTLFQLIMLHHWSRRVFICSKVLFVHQINSCNNFVWIGRGNASNVFLNSVKIVVAQDIVFLSIFRPAFPIN